MSWLYSVLLKASAFILAQTSPILDSPSDGGSTSDTTPKLTFHATDPQGDPLNYEVQIDTKTLVDGIKIGTSANGQITDLTPSLSVDTLASTSKLIVFAGNHQGTISAITLNGNALTKMATAATGFNETAEIWYIDNPGALTGATLTGTFSGGSGRSLSYICLENTKDGVEDVEATNTGSNNSPTVDIRPLVDGSIILVSAYAEDNFTQGAGENNISILESDSYECAAASYVLQTARATQTANFTIGSGQRWAIAAVAIAPRMALIDEVSGGNQVTEVFTSNDTWQAPPGVTSVQIEAWGGGGGGAAGAIADAGGGGGGGAYSKKNS